VSEEVLVPAELVQHVGGALGVAADRFGVGQRPNKQCACLPEGSALLFDPSQPGSCLDSSRNIGSLQVFQGRPVARLQLLPPAGSGRTLRLRERRIEIRAGWARRRGIRGAGRVKPHESDQRGERSQSMKTAVRRDQGL
jgi:hypothetical protein